MSIPPDPRTPSGADSPPVPLLRSERLSALSGVVHGFTTREGGVGRVGLDLAWRADEPDEVLRENWRRTLAALGGHPLSRLAVTSQVHGATVVRVDAPLGPLRPVGEADGAVTVRRDVVLAVRVADCVPVLLASPGGVAVAHAGWRGTVAGVVGATVSALVDLTGESPAEVVAAIGPCISGAAYEVGDEVVRGLRDAGLPDDAFLHPTTGRPRVDLGRAVEAQLRDAGVEQVDRPGWCTFTEPRFFSYRREGPGMGRLAGVIGRTP